ncbi:MAG: methyltransferase domain-containing protein [Planctomycetes bacterium]|nr:methyltransferase domain-containing protein [Planctomycetota bacterium]
MWRNLIVRLLGWSALPLQGDILFVERLAWVRTRLTRGTLKTLDAGCGTGALTLLAARLGNDALGLTSSDADATLATERAGLVGAKQARFRVFDLRQLGPASSDLGLFDQVIACEVIEHLRDDERLLANLVALLKPGGRLLLTTPSVDHYPVYGEKVSEIEDGGHVRYGYSHADLDRLFAEAGLRVVERGYLNGFFAQKLFSCYLRLYRIHPKFGWVITLPFRPLRVFDPLLARLTGYPYMSATVVGEKPLSETLV